MRLRAQEVDRAGYIAKHLLVRDAAAFAHLGDHLLLRAVADAEVKARRERGIAVMGEFAGDLAGPFVPARHMVDDDDTGMRSGVARMRVIGFAAIAAVAAIIRHARLYIAKRHAGPPGLSVALPRRPGCGDARARALSSHRRRRIARLAAAPAPRRIGNSPWLALFCEKSGPWRAR